MGVHRRPYRPSFFSKEKGSKKNVSTVTDLVQSFDFLLGNESFYYLTVPLLLKEPGQEDL